MTKLIISVASGLILIVIVGLFNFSSRLVTLEAKVPAIELSHKVAEKSINEELTYIRGRVDNIYTILTKHK